MKRTVALLLCLLLFAVCSAEVIGMTLPDFEAQLPDGSVFSLEEARGKYDCVVINIWGAWCPWCVREFPYLEEAWAEYSDRVGLICLSAFDSNESIPAFCEANGIKTLPLCYDSADITSLVVMRGYPTTVAVNSAGECIYCHIGALMSTDAAREMFDNLLAVTGE